MGRTNPWLIGLVGGLAMGSIAEHDENRSPPRSYLATSNPSNLSGVTSFINPMPGDAGLGYNPTIEATRHHLPHVEAVDGEAGLNIIPLDRHGVPESPGIPGHCR